MSTIPCNQNNIFSGNSVLIIFNKEVRITITRIVFDIFAAIIGGFRIFANTKIVVDMQSRILVVHC